MTSPLSPTIGSTVDAPETHAKFCFDLCSGRKGIEHEESFSNRFYSLLYNDTVLRLKRSCSLRLHPQSQNRPHQFFAPRSAPHMSPSATCMTFLLIVVTPSFPRSANSSASFPTVHLQHRYRAVVWPHVYALSEYSSDTFHHPAKRKTGAPESNPNSLPPSPSQSRLRSPTPQRYHILCFASLPYCSGISSPPRVYVGPRSSAVKPELDCAHSPQSSDLVRLTSHRFLLAAVLASPSRVSPLKCRSGYTVSSSLRLGRRRIHLA